MYYMKLNDITVKKLEEAFAIGADVTAACAFANITRQTFYNWINDNKELKERIDTLRETTVLKAFNTINENLKDVNTAKWYIEKKRKKDFGNSLDVTTDGEAITGFNYIKNEANNSSNDKAGESLE